MKEVKMSLMCLQLLVMECMLYPCVSELITLTSSEDIANGKWFLEEHYSATLVCTISSYAGQMIWLFNSSTVAECTITYCRQISTGDGTFMFGFDTMNGVFEWTINAVDIAKHNGQVFVCFDGTNASNVTAVVKEIARVRNDSDESDIRQKQDIGVAAITIACIACVLICIIILVTIWKPQEAKKKCTEMHARIVKLETLLGNQENATTANTNRLQIVEENSVTKHSLNTNLVEMNARIVKLETLLQNQHQEITANKNMLQTVKYNVVTKQNLNETLKEMIGSDGSVKELLDNLQRQLHEITTKLQTVEDISETKRNLNENPNAMIESSESVKTPQNNMEEENSKSKSEETAST